MDGDPRAEMRASVRKDGTHIAFGNRVGFPLLRAFVDVTLC